jgi:heme exporter protein D
MIWTSWSEFFAMGGYAVYVWGSFSVVALFMAGEVVLVRHRTKTVKKQLAQARRVGSAMTAGRRI